MPPRLRDYFIIFPLAVQRDICPTPPERSKAGIEGAAQNCYNRIIYQKGAAP